MGVCIDGMPFSQRVRRRGGTFVAFRFLLRKDRKKRAAISYGIGHGGMESILVLGILSVTYLMLFFYRHRMELLMLSLVVTQKFREKQQKLP